MIILLATVPEILLEMLLVRQKFKVLGVTLTLGATVVCYYILIVNAAIMGTDTINEWSFNYMISWMLDFALFTVVGSYFKIKVINICIDGGNSLFMFFARIFMRDGALAKFFNAIL